jgi:hypothetical protein
MLSLAESGIDPFGPAHRSNPFPVYAELRERSPLWWNDAFDEWVVTRYADCEAILRDHRWSSNPSHLPEQRALDAGDLRLAMREVGVNILLFMDPPDHSRVRSLVSKAFTPRAVERMRPRVAEIVTELIGDVGPGETFDLMARLAAPLPVIVICELIGVPAADWHLFGPWSSDATRLLDGDIETDVANRGMVAVMQLLNYLNGLIDERRATPRDDMLSALIDVEEAGERLSDTELRTLVILLFIAGHETTTNLIGNGMLALLGDPVAQARLRDDPSVVASGVEELLRFDGPVHFTARIATTDLSVAGEVMPRGQQVVTVLAAANRDPRRFDEPDRLQLARPDNRHLAFSHGIHYCLGAALARVEGQVAIPAVLQRFPDLALAGAPQWREHLVLRGLRSLILAT